MDIEAKLNNIGAPDDIKTEVVGLAEQCKAKLGIDPNEILNAIDKKIKAAPAGMDEEEKIRRAYMTVKGLFDKQLDSPAITVGMVVLGINENFDVNGKKVRDALEYYRANPEKAIQERIVDEKGVPLDMKQIDGIGRANPNYGKPLVPQFLRNVFGLYRKDEEPWRIFRTTLGHKFHELDVKPMAYCKPRINIASKQDNPDETAINPSQFTDYAEKAWPKDIKNVEALLMDEDENPLPLIEKHTVALGEIPNWHEVNKDNFRRLLITVGDVSWIDPSPHERTGSLRIELKDPTLPENIHHINGFVPAHCLNEKGRLGFGSGSKVIVVAGTSASQRTDNETNETWTQYNLNVQGIYAIAKHRFAEDEAPAGVATKQVE